MRANHQDTNLPNSQAVHTGQQTSWTSKKVYVVSEKCQDCFLAHFQEMCFNQLRDNVTPCKNSYGEERTGTVRTVEGHQTINKLHASTTDGAGLEIKSYDTEKKLLARHESWTHCWSQNGMLARNLQGFADIHGNDHSKYFTGMVNMIFK